MAVSLLGGVLALSVGCTGMVAPGDGTGATSGGTGNATGTGTGSTSGTGSMTGTGSTSGSGGAGNGVATGSGGSGTGTGNSGATGSGGAGGAPVVSKGGVMLRLLTQAEYRTSVQALLGTLTTPLTLADDSSTSGFVSVGASSLTVTDGAVTAYEKASRDATAEVFADTARWQKLVGCAPKADLSDACVSTYIKTFGKSAFRRDLTTDEATQWLGVAKSAATLAGTAAQGLASATSGLLQSPNFLYRVETNKVDSSNGRLKYDGLSMATRLSYLLTGGPPTAALLTAAASGQLDTADGIRTASAPLLTGTVMADRMTAFFSEYAEAQMVPALSKSTTLFPSFNQALKDSMAQSMQLFVKNIVLGANADVRSFYDSDKVYVDASLAALYGVQAPASGFGQVTLPATSGRAGILGQAGWIAAHSQSDKNSPTRRGIFIVQSLLCTVPPPPLGGVPLVLPPPDATHTTRQQLETHRMDMKCATCHAMFDPLGLALEHFDPIGKYRANENGLAIDATGTLSPIVSTTLASFDGEAQLGAALKQEPRAIACLARNFYRNANGRAEDDKDLDQVNAMVQALSARSYVWGNFLADFVASDAFRSAPALPVTTGS